MVMQVSGVVELMTLKLCTCVSITYKEQKWENWKLSCSLLSDLYTEISNMRTGLIACFFQ